MANKKTKKKKNVVKTTLAMTTNMLEITKNKIVKKLFKLNCNMPFVQKIESLLSSKIKNKNERR